MSNIAKCPKCENHQTEINVAPITARDGTQKTLKAAVYTCRSCGTILAAGPDPYVLSEHIAGLVKGR
ncbi:hypothetical protein [Methylogaea oryzae]|uniref:Uncharacterized protein n=1 Tax=Methylogaea oryzae TaxID=1295382 RepID=A0A8D4VM90_9GAMM|nr:hypothetical protein [Methylogaea oryzae]BBL69707.1 hypothetical protein MoryE10_03130 [Methylogaea oryzae]